MKPPAEMNEGPEALNRFENTMRSIFSTSKADLEKTKTGDKLTAAKHKKNAKPNNRHKQTK